jgi:hypothetical protein
VGIVASQLATVWEANARQLASSSTGPSPGLVPCDHTHKGEKTSQGALSDRKRAVLTERGGLRSASACFKLCPVLGKKQAPAKSAQSARARKESIQALMASRRAAKGWLGRQKRRVLHNAKAVGPWQPSCSGPSAETGATFCCSMQVWAVLALAALGFAHPADHVQLSVREPRFGMAAPQADQAESALSGSSQSIRIGSHSGSRVTLATGSKDGSTPRGWSVALHGRVLPLQMAASSPLNAVTVLPLLTNAPLLRPVVSAVALSPQQHFGCLGLSLRVEPSGSTALCFSLGNQCLPIDHDANTTVLLSTKPLPHAQQGTWELVVQSQGQTAAASGVHALPLPSWCGSDGILFGTGFPAGTGQVASQSFSVGAPAVLHQWFVWGDAVPTTSFHAVVGLFQGAPQPEPRLMSSGEVLRSQAVETTGACARFDSVAMGILGLERPDPSNAAETALLRISRLTVPFRVSMHVFPERDEELSDTCLTERVAWSLLGVVDVGTVTTAADGMSRDVFVRVGGGVRRVVTSVPLVANEWSLLEWEWDGVTNSTVRINGEVAAQFQEDHAPGRVQRTADRVGRMLTFGAGLEGFSMQLGHALRVSAQSDCLHREWHGKIDSVGLAIDGVDTIRWGFDGTYSSIWSSPIARDLTSLPDWALQTLPMTSGSCQGLSPLWGMNHPVQFDSTRASPTHHFALTPGQTVELFVPVFTASMSMPVIVVEQVPESVTVTASIGGQLSLGQDLRLLATHASGQGSLHLQATAALDFFSPQQQQLRLCVKGTDATCVPHSSWEVHFTATGTTSSVQSVAVEPPRSIRVLGMSFSDPDTQ